LHQADLIIEHDIGLSQPIWERVEKATNVYVDDGSTTKRHPIYTYIGAPVGLGIVGRSLRLI
jgi:hypothetical protein